MKMESKIKLLSQKELDSIPSFKDHKEIKNRAIHIGTRKIWENEDEQVKEAELILHNWFSNAINKNDNELCKKLVKVMAALNSASQVFFKAYTCEVMENHYKRKIEQHQSNELKFAEKINKLELEIKNIKSNLEL